jgi:putative endonuclease
MPDGSRIRSSSRASRGSRQRLGRAGEEVAVEALRAEGYRIVERNVRLRRGELDVIAEEAGELVFVEVKTRRSSTYGTPAESVGPRKRHALAQLAAGYLARRGLGNRACRFDVVEVWVDASGSQRVEILRDAFRP